MKAPALSLEFGTLRGRGSQGNLARRASLRKRQFTIKEKTQLDFAVNRVHQRIDGLMKFPQPPDAL